MSSIEDVIMNGNNTKAPKKGHPFLLIFMFIIIVALCLLIYFRFFYVKDEIIDYTEEFFSYMQSSNTKTFLNDTLYSEILKKIETKDFEAEHFINLSTTMDKEELNDIDLSKLIINVNSVSKKENSENFYDINVKYLDNQIINCKAIEKENDIYVTSDEIVNMYIGGEKKSFYPILSTILNKENIDFYKTEKIKNILKNRIEYTDLDIPIYAKLVKDSIEPGKIQKKDNVIIQNEESSITAVEYKIELSQEETNQILIKVLEKLKNDDDLLNKFTNNQIINEEEQQVNLNTVGENNIQNTTNVEQIVEENVEEQANIVENNIQVIQNDSLNANTENNSPISNIKLNNETSEANNVNDESIETDNQTFNIEEAKEIIKSAVLKEEKNISLNDLKDAIQTIINELPNLQGDGVTVSIYVENGKIVKLSMNWIDGSNLDIEFNEISEKENKIKITYLKDTEKSNGFSIELYKNKNEAATEFDILFNNIENKKITKKLKIETNLKGTVLSNSISNTILVTYTDSTGEFKVNLNSEVNLVSEKQIEELNENNSFNLVTAEEIYKQNLIEQLKATIDSVYNSKKEQMKLIDNNTSSSEISTNIPKETNNSSGTLLSNATKEEARQVLVDKISQMMAEAQNNNEEFGLNKLNGLEIEGHKISAIINSDLAIITIDGYTFNIDSEFNLSDV